MTLADRQISVAHDAAPGVAPQPVHRPWSRRVIDALIPGRGAAIHRYQTMVESARQNPPPQRWYDEDFSELRKPRSS